MEFASRIIFPLDELFLTPTVTDLDVLTYLERREHDIDHCLTALQKEDWETLSRIGNRIRGNAETFGFPPLTQIGEMLEKGAEDRNPSALSKVISEFAELVSRELKRIRSQA